MIQEVAAGFGALSFGSAAKRESCLAQRVGCLKHRKSAPTLLAQRMARRLNRSVGQSASCREPSTASMGQPAAAAALGLRRRRGMRWAWRGKMSAARRRIGAMAVRAKRAATDAKVIRLRGKALPSLGKEVFLVRVGSAKRPPRSANRSDEAGDRPKIGKGTEQARHQQAGSLLGSCPREGRRIFGLRRGHGKGRAGGG